MMGFSLDRWRPRHLLAAWAVYWTGLVAVTLGPAVAAIARVATPQGKGSVSAAFDNWILHLDVTSAGAPAWSGSARLGVIALWVAGPPLVLWAAWLLKRPARGAALGAPRTDALPPGQPPIWSAAHERERRDEHNAR